MTSRIRNRATRNIGIQSFAIAITGGAIATPLQSWAQALSPKTPAIEQFTDCEFSKNPGIFESIQICSLPASEATRHVGKSVDGDKSKRHFSWHLSKMTIKDPEGNPTGYKITQFAYDCAAQQGLERIVEEFVNIPGIGITPYTDPSSDYLQWKPAAGLNLDFLRNSCPARPGFTRIGELQFAFGQTIRRGNTVNIRAINRAGQSLVFSVDCSSISYGVNAKPSKPIMPGSVGGEVYKRLCR